MKKLAHNKNYYRSFFSLLVPRVQFESGYYEFNSTEAVSVCLRYDAVPSDFDLDFQVGINITSSLGKKKTATRMVLYNCSISLMNIKFSYI